MLKMYIYILCFCVICFAGSSPLYAEGFDQFSDESDNEVVVKASYQQSEEFDDFQTNVVNENEDLQERLIQAEKQIEFLLNQQQKATQVNYQVPIPENENIPEYDSLPGSETFQEGPSLSPTNPSLEYPHMEWVPGSETCAECEEVYPDYYSDYDGGFVIRPFDKKKTPFELKINGRMQFRYTGLSRDKKSFTNRTGFRRLIQNRSDFEIERGRLEFSGFMYDPKLQFYLNLDGDTDDNHDMKVHDFWINYQFSKAFNLYIGKAFVPGSREWLGGSTRTQLIDRSVATTFFRPDRSIGVWASGEINRIFFYRAMVGNGVETTDLEDEDVNDSFAYSGSVWFEPLDEFGKGNSDLSYHKTVALRIGSSFTFSSEGGTNELGNSIPESNIVRLTDGTRLTSIGALAPGVTVEKFKYYLLATDFALKYKGLSISSEYYFRWLNDFSTTGPVSHDKLYDDGFYIASGYMLKPKKLEIMGRASKIDGIFGDSWSYAGGFNYFLNGTHKNKLSFDVTVLHGNPSNNSGPNLRVGDDGPLFRAQYQIAF